MENDNIYNTIFFIYIREIIMIKNKLSNRNFLIINIRYNIYTCGQLAIN